MVVAAWTCALARGIRSFAAVARSLVFDDDLAVRCFALSSAATNARASEHRALEAQGGGCGRDCADFSLIVHRIQCHTQLVILVTLLIDSFTCNIQLCRYFIRDNGTEIS